MTKKRVRRKTNTKRSLVDAQSNELTFLDHIREVQGRLFSVIAIFLVIAAASFPFFDKIVNLLVAPLGNEHQLVYLTPSGAFGFMMQVCLYVGLIGTLPFIVYHVYRFVMPVVQTVKLGRVLLYVLVSLFLAIAGIVFAYVVSLPAALYFLTGFNLYHINPMLTIDSYFSFVMTYLLAGAALFQLPLVMMIINTVTPLTPRKLMGQQGKIILGSFIVAAIISPTPDALNQAILACPVIVMYQIGILLIWIKNRKHRSKAPEFVKPKVSTLSVDSPVDIPPAIPVNQQPPVFHRLPRSLDGFIQRAPRVAPKKVVVPVRQQCTIRTKWQPAHRSIDGILPHQPKRLVLNA